ISRGIEELLVTSDGPARMWLSGGTVDGALATVNFGSRTLQVLEMAQRELPEQPQMCMEFWNGWFDHWGEEHHERTGGTAGPGRAGPGGRTGRRGLGPGDLRFRTAQGLGVAAGGFAGQPQVGMEVLDGRVGPRGGGAPRGTGGNAAGELADMLEHGMSVNFY